AGGAAAEGLRRCRSATGGRGHRGRLHGADERAGSARRVTDVITARDLTRRFGNFTAVDHISFDVGAGEVFGFLGANGAGKTTAIKILIGLLAPSEGDARVAGFDVRHERESIR